MAEENEQAESNGAAGARPLPGLMAKSPMDEKLAELLDPMVAALGFRLVRIRMMGGRRPTLQIMAERPDGSMEVDDCAGLSHAVSAYLDAEDPIKGEYVLEVSSPGIDRPLTRPADFERFKGHVAKLETRDLVEGRKRFRGDLIGLVGGQAVIEGAEFGRVALPLDGLQDAKLVLTDALISESLKGGRKPLGAAADGAEVDLESAEFESAEIDDPLSDGAEIDGAEMDDAERDDPDAPKASDTPRP